LSVALTPDNKTAVTGGNDQTVRLWSLPDGRELYCFKGHQSAVVQVRVDADGDTIDSAGSQHQLQEKGWRRWSIVDRREIGSRTSSPDDRFGCVAFSPDGRHLLAGGPGGRLRLWSW